MLPVPSPAFPLPFIAFACECHCEIILPARPDNKTQFVVTLMVEFTFTEQEHILDYKVANTCFISLLLPSHIKTDILSCKENSGELGRHSTFLHFFFFCPFWVNLNGIPLALRKRWSARSCSVVGPFLPFSRKSSKLTLRLLDELEEPFGSEEQHDVFVDWLLLPAQYFLTI